MTVVSLPDLPEGKEFEELVAAVFQIAGLYVARNIIERDVVELLELDAVVTGYDGTTPRITVVEAKSSDWGFSDIFKLLGWKAHLRPDEAIFVARYERDHMDFIRTKARELGIDVYVVTDPSEAVSALSDATGVAEADAIGLAIWRYSYLMERALIRRLNQLARDERDRTCFRALKDYYFRINSGIFFAKDVLTRLHQLYSAFRRHPYISAKTACELAGDKFDDDHKLVPKHAFEETFFDCEYNAVQISMFVEHRARLAIMKGAVDYVLLRDAGETRKTGTTLVLRLGDRKFELPLLQLLPSSFKDGLADITSDKYFRKYPVFWQWFMWFFGGFILLDYEEREYELLSQKTGIPVEEVPSALAAYDRLFPHEGGWFAHWPTANIRFLEMFPRPFMGIGAFLRRRVYTETGRYRDLKLTGQHTHTDLVKWNNLGVQVLAESGLVPAKSRSD